MYIKYILDININPDLHSDFIPYVLPAELSLKQLKKILNRDGIFQNVGKLGRT